MEGDVEGSWSGTVAVNGFPLDSSSVVFEPADKGTDPLSTASSLSSMATPTTFSVASSTSTAAGSSRAAFPASTLTASAFAFTGSSFTG